MRHVETVKCPYCSDEDLRKNGHTPNGTQRWSCKGCRRTFQFGYRYNGCHASVKDKIIAMTTNGSGIRDTSRVLGVSQNTVISTIKKNSGGN